MKDDSSLRKAVESLPDACGVYLLKDEAGEVLYVGKARSLRGRVSSYLSSSGHSPKIQAMLRRWASVEYIRTSTEMEALLKEWRLVRELKPRYNTELKDDKSYPFVEVTLGEEFPAVRIVRPAVRDPRSVYFGPFTAVGELRKVLKVLQAVFGFRTCKDRIEEGRPRRCCLLYHIGRCLAPCIGAVDREEYGRSIEAFMSFMEGDMEATIRSLEDMMKEAAASLRFEEAALRRDQIAALKNLGSVIEAAGSWVPDIEPLVPEVGCRRLGDLFSMKSPTLVEGVDVSLLSGRAAAGAKVVFRCGIPYKKGYRRYKIKFAAWDDCAMIAEVLRRRFRPSTGREGTLPDLMVVDGGLPQLNAAVGVLSELGVNVFCVALAKRREEIFIPGKSSPLRLPPEDPALRLLQCVRDEAHRFAVAYHRKLRDPLRGYAGRRVES